MVANYKLVVLDIQETDFISVSLVIFIAKIKLVEISVYGAIIM